jgi:release factor glutamine methyltransferase
VTLAEVLAGATDYLEARGVEHPRLDAERLISRALGLTRIELYTQFDRPLDQEERAAARALVQRRGSREPLAYVLGDWDFRRLTLKTDARALVPRPETEILVVGTGSGAIALSIAQEHSGARVTATDSSPDALALARENADALDLDVRFVETDLLAGVEGPFELVVSNPPYVLATELDALEPEVRDWEPRAALVDAGQTERLARDARDVLDGWLVLEAHEEHAPQLAARLEELGYGAASITPDNAGRPRVVEARWQPTTTSNGR